MSRAENEKIPKEVKTGVTLASIGQSCFNKDWMLQLNQPEQIDNFICLICRQVTNNAIEINCPQHQVLDMSPIVGENCLKQFLNANPNSCPIQFHNGCLYAQTKIAQRQIDSLKVICPLQFEQNSLLSTQGRQQGGEENERIMCDFKGKIKELKNHLDNVCPLKLFDCWYKPFGCEYSCHKHKLQDHLSSEVKFHFDLAVKLVRTLQEEIKQLQLQPQLNEKMNDNNEVLINENVLLKKKAQQLQAVILEMEKENLKKDIELKSKIIELRQKELLEKDNEMKKTQRELLKLRADIETMRKDELQKKDEKINQDIHNLSEKEEKNDDTLLSSNVKHYSSTCSFDLFCASSKLLKTFNGHTNAVWGIDYSTFDDFRVWDVETAKQIQILNGHTSGVWCVKFSPYHRNCHGGSHRGNVICSSSQDKTIRFWDFETAKEFQVLNEHTNFVGGFEFSPFNNGRYLCSGGWDRTIRLWDVDTFKTLHVFNGHTNAVWCVDFSPLQSNNNSNINNSVGVIGGNGYNICSGSFDNTICIWDIETVKELAVFKGHDHYVCSIKYSPFETNILCSGANNIHLWDIRSKKEIQIFKGHTSQVWAVTYPPFVTSNDGSSSSITNSCGNIICSGSWDNTIRFWDVRANKQLFMIKGENKDNGICFLQFSPLRNKKNQIKSANHKLFFKRSKNLLISSLKMVLFVVNDKRTNIICLFLAFFMILLIRFWLLFNH
ncbi:G-protein beta WD-40 repeats containing protein [Reticulomyxa filosa]|uniref:G-protein beta WD-40 repeats containing protein n=1 Tax=Reticulomyxa filosa TaxID=46433 RepID=X6NL22_RETFI|nr:G-protein beta WD-40 repeats containing protein [Reticulomyxa filosa]|eukprot:ETO26087.1 G-protein beta WD-40 repeats containing protein [Reticulomyxa filosa]